MGNIVVLDELTINKIAAGEVIERPASVIKEMVENSIDAGAAQITVEIRRGGITYIRVTDNGGGIEYDDVLLAFEKHATSKITCGDDLDGIETLGFRGEALSSISAVSRVEVTTKLKDKAHGIKVSIHGGALIENTSCGCPDGTTFVVRDLFFNTPVRYKFLKKDATEAGHVIDLMERMALAHPEIAFRLINNNSEVLRTRGDGVLKNVVYAVYGKEVADRVKAINYSDKGIEITGFAGDINSGTAGRNRQSLFINGRYVRSKIVYSAIDEAYKTLMMKGKHPFIILNVKILPQHVDVNVHPTKMEVRFSDDGAVYRWVYNAIGAALYNRAYTDAPLFTFTEQGQQGYQQQYTSETAQIQVSQTQESLSAKGTQTEIPQTHERSRAQAQTPEEPLNTNKQSQARSGTDYNQNAQSNDYREYNNQAVSKMYKSPFDTMTKSEVREERLQWGQDSLSDISAPRTAEADSDKVGVAATDGQANLKGHTEPKAWSEERDILENALYTGQVFNTYIILQYKNELVILDQHAAHERVMYEKIKTQYISGDYALQPLLTPVVAELSKSEFAIYRSNQEFFKTLGFESEEFGDESVLIRSIPAYMEISVVKNIFADVIHDIMGERENLAVERAEISDDILKMMACKAAVKANHKLTEAEVRSLLDSMLKLENPFTCPHGRPTVIRLGMAELEKKFKRTL